MAANAGTISLALTVDDKGTVTVKRFASSADDKLRGLSKTVTTKLGRAFSSMGRLATGTLKGIGRQVLSLKGAIVGLGLGLLAKSAVDTASGFEQMQISLDTITKGKGEETFRMLNEWALQMPVNTQKAIDSYRLMLAMGLKPTIEQMTILVDTASALGGGEEAMQGISRALGQMAAKGKVSAEELMQLAERGVPAMQILADRFGNVETSTLDAGETVQALFEGMEQLYGGQSQKQMSTYAGLVEAIKGYWTEFVKNVMESGVFDYIKTHLDNIVSKIQEWYSSGQLKEWAKQVGDKIIEALEGVKRKAMLLYDWFLNNWPNIIQDFKEDFKETTEKAKEIGKALLWVIRTAKKAYNWVSEVGGKLLSSLSGMMTGEIANKLAEPIKAPIVEPQGKLSPPKPWKETIAEMQDDINGLGETINTTFDFSGFKQAVTSGPKAFVPGADIFSLFGKYRLTVAGGKAKYMGLGNVGGGYEHGTDYVPRTGPYMLHQGESVSPAGSRSGRDAMTIREITINVNGAQSPSQTARQIRDELERLEARGA